MSYKLILHEVWTVKIGSFKGGADNIIYHVFAHSAAEAEKKAMKLAKKEQVEMPYCQSASYELTVLA